jgi:hypothetical protein
LFYFENKIQIPNQIQRRFAALRSDCDVLLLEDKSTQKLLSLKITDWLLVAGCFKPEKSLIVDRESAEEKGSLALICFSCLPAAS